MASVRVMVGQSAVARGWGHLEHGSPAGVGVAVPRVRGSGQTVPQTPITNPREKALRQLSWAEITPVSVYDLKGLALSHLGSHMASCRWQHGVPQGAARPPTQPPVREPEQPGQRDWDQLWGPAEGHPSLAPPKGPL